jgi:ketosteroid isomerase-like protein
MAFRGRLGAYATLSRHDPRALTAAARERFLQRFLDEVDPDSALPAGERERRARFARKRYFAELARKSALARRKPQNTHSEVTTTGEEAKRAA